MKTVSKSSALKGGKKTNKSLPGALKAGGQSKMLGQARKGFNGSTRTTKPKDV